MPVDNLDGAFGHETAEVQGQLPHGPDAPDLLAAWLTEHEKAIDDVRVLHAEQACARVLYKAKRKVA